ncbi:MAG: hypothetical protein Q9217_005009 [Psora testacea]
MNVLSSSPDPLGLLDEKVGNFALSRPEQPEVTPRKQLLASNGNLRVEEFYLADSRVRSRSSSPVKGQEHKDDRESPWRIRLTVQAERVDEAQRSVPPVHLTEHRTTTTIPLKGGGDNSKVMKRARGRPRKSTDGPMKRNGTPKPKAAGQGKTLPQMEAVLIEESWAPRSPTTGGTRSRRSIKPENKISPLKANSITTPTRYTPERTVSARPFSRTKSRTRRKAITPVKVAKQASVECEANTAEKPSNMNSRNASIDETLANPKWLQVFSVGIADNKAQDVRLYELDQSATSLEGSALDVQDEQMWRSMIRKDSVSPTPDISNGLPESPRTDPTEDQQGYDTILESEEFSMVSVESLQSTGILAGEGGDHPCSPHTPVKVRSYQPPTVSEAKLSDEPRTPNEPVSGKSDSMNPRPALQTPQVRLPSPVQTRQTPAAKMTTPSMPPAPHVATLGSSERNRDETDEKSPKLERVVRAAAALQGIPSPQHRAAGELNPGLESPFSVDPEHSALAAEQEMSRNESNASFQLAKQRPGIFNGFSVGTRRELRAGLRLGEELSKRQQSSLPSIGEVRKPDESFAHFQMRPAYRQLPATEGNGHSGHQIIVNEQAGELQVRYPLLSNNQLPSPERSEIDGDDDHMSWKADTPTKSEPIQEAALSSASALALARDASNIDHTMLAKEEEWQREREAVSKQIREANSSQVVVIDSDDEDYHSQDLDEEGGIKGASAWEESTKPLKDFSMPALTSPEVLLQPEVVKPRRSKLPSPWSRDSRAMHTRDSELSESDLFWQPDLAQIEAAKKRQHRREQNVGPESSSQFKTARSTDVNRASCSEGHLETPVWNLSSRLLDPAVKNNSVKSPQTPDFQDGSSEDESDEDIEEHIEPTNDLQRTGPTISLADDESAASVPLPGSPSMPPIDPVLLPSTKQLRPPASVQVRENSQQTRATSSSWFSALTAPITSLFTATTSTPAFAYPPATVSDILASSPPEPLSLHHPWTNAHLRALEPLVNASVFYTPHIFPYNHRSHSAHLLGATVTTARGWARKVTKADCGVIDAFLIVLRHRGVVTDWRRKNQEMIGTEDIARNIISLWVMMVMRGDVKTEDWNGVKVGLRMSRDRGWREEDIKWKYNRSRYFEEKRRDFEREGLPSWKKKGLLGPFNLQ